MHCRARSTVWSTSHNDVHTGEFSAAVYFSFPQQQSSHWDYAASKCTINDPRIVNTLKNTAIPWLKVGTPPGICPKTVRKTTKNLTGHLVSLPRFKPRTSQIWSRRPKQSTATQKSAVSKGSHRTRHFWWQPITGSLCLKAALGKNRKFQITSIIHLIRNLYCKKGRYGRIAYTKISE